MAEISTNNVVSLQYSKLYVYVRKSSVRRLHLSVYPLDHPLG
jgi:hypothetical protein